MSLTRNNLREVKRLCRELDKLCQAVESEMNVSEALAHIRNPEVFGDDYRMSTPYGSPKTAELRRRSMDLTRALAELRR